MIYLAHGQIYDLQVGVGDLAAIPPDASLFAADDWKALCALAGDEAKLLKLLEVKDARTRED